MALAVRFFLCANECRPQRIMAPEDMNRTVDGYGERLKKKKDAEWTGATIWLIGNAHDERRSFLFRLAAVATFVLLIPFK